jgi:SAM-dependent methyltransferase
MTTMWTGAEAYDQLMGRWSRFLAPLLVEFAEVQNGDRVLDVGCGTGSLTRALLEHMTHSEIVSVDSTSSYIEYARQQLPSPRARFEVEDAQNLPYPDAAFNKCLSLLVVNFIPNARRALGEMCRVTRPEGTVAAAVWDYGEGMEMLRILWDTAVALDPASELRHERNMPYCRKGELGALWTESGLQHVEETSLTIPLEFSSFEDYWTLFLAGVAPSGSYVSSLAVEHQGALRDHLRQKLLGGKEARSFTLQARAWAVRGIVPKQ